MSDDRRRIVHIELDEQAKLRHSPQVEHERKVAIFDLLEENLFAPVGDDRGPYHLVLGVQENRLGFDVRDTQGQELLRFQLPLRSFRSVVKDYFLICDSYYAAIKTMSPSQIEAIDMGRRGIHDDGANLLVERLAGNVDIDKATARRLFTLICVLHIRVRDE